MKKTWGLLAIAACSLLLTSCFDSKVPLSDPQKAKPDDALMGVWRFQSEGGEINYYHFGHAGDKLPASLMQVVFVQHTPDGNIRSAELLAFPTTLGGKTYLNVAEASPEQLKLLEEEGWTGEVLHEYLILQYQITGNTLTIKWIDNEMKKKAIVAGKIKGIIENDQGHFTDTSEHLAKLLTEAGDTLFSKDVLPLARVK
jgi:hypothetical protein